MQSDAGLRSAKESVQQRITDAGEQIVGLSHMIHGEPELGFEERSASGWVADLLERTGYDVSRGAGDLETALEASAGTGGRSVALVAEYDALPEVGHACGHNIIAAIATGAAIGLQPMLDDIGLEVRLIGAPAEEGGGGKILLLEAGVFDGVDAALMVHPGPVDLPYMPTLATTRLDVRFQGKAAHASAFPERGVNAADAATVSQVAIGLLRQQLRPDMRVHGIVTRGGEAPNVIPAQTQLDYLIRAGEISDLGDLEKRIRACFEAGATATGASLQVDKSMPDYAELIPDPQLTSWYQSNAESLGRSFRAVDERVRKAAGSTDMGNVSQVIRSIHPMIGLGRDSGTIHSPEFARASISAEGDRAIVDGAVALASTVIDYALTVEV